MTVAAPADLPARVGRYEVMARIGRGGMAEVFLARAVGPGGIAKRLCIKRMLPDLLLSPRALDRFSEEARTVLALQHANIVPVFDFGRDGQNLFLAMEWIDGCDLAALVAATRARGELLPPQVAAHVTAEVARALAYAHAPHADRPPVLHSDVTPRNILLSRQGEVRLTDFGIARALGGAAARAGTPAYMAPEAARGEAVDQRSDLYSLGLVFAEMLTGRRLRESNDAGAAAAPVAVPGMGGVPTPFVEIARRLLAPDPADRFGSAGDVVNALAAPLAAELVRGGEAPARTLAALVAQAAPGVAIAAAEAPETMAPPTVDFVSEAPAPAAAVAGAPRALTPRRLVALAAIVAAGAIGGAGMLAAARRNRPPPVAASPRPIAVPPAPVPLIAPAPAVPVAPAPAVVPPPARQARAHLKIAAPGSWVAVYLDDRKLGDGPGLFDIEAGKHRLRVENAPLGFSRRETINAAPGATVELTFHTRP
jgi:tRNA A-37 threonylcarbamoyl transferase component Bud32